MPPNVPPSSTLAEARLQEAKEAVVDALLNLTTDRVSGVGAYGACVQGRTPRSAFVSGFLMPRYDSKGEDETSDIHVSVIGIDAQVHRSATGTATVVPKLSLYVRVLPEWGDVASRREELARTFSLSPEYRDRLKVLTEEKRRQKREQAGLPAKVEENDKGRRRQILEQLRAIKREAFREARAELGLPPVGLERVQPTVVVLPDSAPGGEQSSDGSRLDQGAPVLAADTLVGLLACPPGSLVPIDPPMKWIRITPELPKFEFAFQSEGKVLQAAVETYNATLESALSTGFNAWLTGEDGRASAWRDVQVMPADLQNEETWKGVLARARARPADPEKCAPALSVSLAVARTTDFADPSRIALRVALENHNRAPPRNVARTRELSVFQASVQLAMPVAALADLRLDRVDPSYRFRNHLSYPAMGLNCGVEAERIADTVTLRTTWAPRWTQPRLVPSNIDVECRFSKLSEERYDVRALLALPAKYREWIARSAHELLEQVTAGLSGRERDRELAAFNAGLDAQRREADLIERGIRLLVDAAAAWKSASAAIGAARERQLRLSMPWLAWRYMNESFFEREKRSEERAWRLFQLAFVLAHLGGLVSREPEWAHLHDPALDEETASLLYFPTGGGKSEAFYGVLLFALFFDRLRGKQRGVTGLVRYPLRLLTLQQAQRFLRLLTFAELVRGRREVGSWPYELGFWVGRSNTPNRVGQFSSAIPDLGAPGHADDKRLRQDAENGVKAARAYWQDLESYNKVPKCPVCGGETGLRRVAVNGELDERIGIVCFSASSECAWNASDATGLRPLPFLLSDDTIYQRAPSVIVGTVDKLAMLGQSLGTIAQVLGMFGLARWILPSGHFVMPRKASQLEEVVALGTAKPVFPAYSSGERVFHDPFPSLIIQDEGHLLEESLGTFAGLFESLLDSVFARIDELSGADLEVARWVHDGRTHHRTPRIIMATATVSRPEAQMTTLYQRTPVLFPSPGHDIWRSFFAEPAATPTGNEGRVALAREVPSWMSPELTAPWMRVYASVMTNGSNHTVTTVAVISAFHCELTRLWRMLREPATVKAAFQQLQDAVRGHGAEWRRAAIARLQSEGRNDLLLALLDLHRVSITYVTNKKGGDQVIDALDGYTRADHERSGVPIKNFLTRLISGGVDMRDIQDVMRLAEKGPPEGAEWPDVDEAELLRNVVATSAISHGVDVDRFNSMFFAGLPSNVAEYIQASSRVGRAHVGFVVLVPTPQSRRDRYVVETHDIYHRFLERMIAAPASERWADNALHRVAASYVQAWLALEESEAFRASPEASKCLEEFDLIPHIERMATKDRIAFGETLAGFAMQAAGVRGRGRSAVGKPWDQEHYSRLMMEDAHRFVQDILAANTSARLSDFWKDPTYSDLAAPMTSLRDVDEAALIKGSHWSERGKIDGEALYHAMKIVRGQRFARSETEADAEADTVPVRG